MHKIHSNMFRHSIGAIIRKSSQWSKQCFPNGPLYAAQSHICTGVDVLFKTREKPFIKC